MYQALCKIVGKQKQTKKLAPVFKEFRVRVNASEM